MPIQIAKCNLIAVFRHFAKFNAHQNLPLHGSNKPKKHRSKVLYRVGRETRVATCTYFHFRYNVMIINPIDYAFLCVVIYICMVPVTEGLH